MLKLLKRNPEPVENEPVGEMAGRLFASGKNCAQAVLEAAGGITDPQMIEVGKALGGGIGGSKCICGALSGGVMVLALKGKGGKSAKLMKAFKGEFKVACCSALSRPYDWKSKEHLSNCRKITARTAELVEELLD